ncbi:cupin domain-containing protein [Flagellimonas sp. 2504JD4-2]
MRHLIFCLIICFPAITLAQKSDYPIKSFLDDGIKAPNTHHIGEAWLNFLLKEEDNLDYNITQATFSPNSTLDWHKHGTPQVLIVLEGKGYYQEKGKDPIIIRKGDVIRCQKETEHWHTSSKDSKISYLAIYGNSPTIWTQKVTREYYNSVSEKLDQD